jgi:DNA polymerase III subunit delta'
MKFSDIQGNNGIKQKLIQTVLDQRVSHAQLFFGPEGNEKLALAIAYAQLINCKNPSVAPLPRRGGAGGGAEADSCGICPSCIKYQKLIHPDLHFIYPVATTKKVSKKPKSQDFIEEWRRYLLENSYRGNLLDWYSFIGIENKQGIINAEDCNEIIHTLSYKSYESEYKVMILWMVEKLYYAAAPKILKILEEPPDKTLFILISEDPDQIISTIRSRTLLVKIPESDVKREEPDDSVNFTAFRNWMRLCFARDVVALVNWSGEIAKTGRENQKSLLRYALNIIETCTSINYGNEKPVISTGEELIFIQNISPFFNSRNIISFTQLFNTAFYHIERNGHAPTLFLDVSLQAIRLFHSASKKITR